MKLGLVTYQMGQDMDCPRLIAFCKETGLAAVELRIGHAHGVDLHFSRTQRADTKKLFAEDTVELAGLGTVCEYHSEYPSIVRKNIEEAKAYAELAADLVLQVSRCGPMVFVRMWPPRKPASRLALLFMKWEPQPLISASRCASRCTVMDRQTRD